MDRSLIISQAKNDEAEAFFSPIYQWADKTENLKDVLLFYLQDLKKQTELYESHFFLFYRDQGG